MFFLFRIFYLFFLIFAGYVCSFNVDKPQPNSKLIKKIIGTLVFTSTTIVNTLIMPSSSLASSIDGSKLFEMSCSGCHSYGGNILNNRKTLKKDSLISNNVNELSKIVDIITNGKGQMPPYGSYKSPIGNIIPAKYNDDEISSIANYILEQAEINWPQKQIQKNCDEYPGC